MAGEIVGVPYVDGNWITLTHKDIPGSRHDVPNTPENLEFFEGKGWTPLVEEPEPEPEAKSKKSSKATKAATEEEGVTGG